jgi:hypothetical protein
MASRRVLRDEDLRLNIILDGKQVPKENKRLMGELGKLERQGTKLEQTYRKLANEQRRLTAEQKKSYDPARALQITQLDLQMDALTISIKDNAKAQKDMRNQIGLTGMTLNQLQTHLKLLRIEQSNMRGDQETWDNLQKEIDKTNWQIKKLTTNSTWLGMVWEDVAHKANKYGAAIAAIGMVVYSVTNFIKQFTGDIKELEDTMAGVRRTTDLTREQILELKNAFDAMDTRTATKDLLDIAKTAGRLGLEKEKILGFVDAFDKINVALGEDLVGNDGNIEDVAKSVGKLVANFQMDKDIPFNEAMLRAGSLLNELDKSSQASASGILEFTTRLSGVAGITSMTIDQVSGIAATLDSMGVSAEMGASAVQRLLLNMAKNAGTYSKILGMSTKDYADLVNKDLNQAFIMLIKKSTEGAQGMMDFQKVLSGLGINEVRATQAFGKLRIALQEVNGEEAMLIKQQRIAKDAVASSNSVMGEFNIMNQNAAAEMDKVDKRLIALRQSVGLELMPTVVSLSKAYADFLYLLKDLFVWVQNHIRQIGGLVIAYSGFKVASIAAMISTRGFATILYGLMKTLPHFIKSFSLVQLLMIRLRYGTVAFNKAWAVFTAGIRANPLGLIITAIGVLAGLFVMFGKKVYDSNNVLKDFYKSLKKINEEKDNSMLEQQAKLNGLFEELKRNYADIEKRKGLIKQINEEYGGYIGKIDAEKVALTELNAIQEQATKGLMKYITLKNLDEELIKKQQLAATLEQKIFEMFKNDMQESGVEAEKAGKAYVDLYKIIEKAELLSATGVDVKTGLNKVKASEGMDYMTWEETLQNAARQFNAPGWDINKELLDPINQLSKLSKTYGGNIIDIVNNILELRNTAKTAKKNIQSFYESALKEFDKVIGKQEELNKQSGGGGTGNDGMTASLKERAEVLEEEYERTQMKLQKQANDQLKSKTWLEDALLKAEKSFLLRKMALAREGNGMITDEEGKVVEKLVDIQSKYEDLRAKEIEKGKSTELQQIEEKYNERILAIEQGYKREMELKQGKVGKADEERYQALILRVELIKLRQERDLLIKQKAEDSEITAKNIEIVKKDIEIVKKDQEIQKMQIDSNDVLIDQTKQLKTARTEYTKALRDEMEMMKEYESIFGKTLIGQLKLYEIQKNMAAKTKGEEIAMNAEQQAANEENHKNKLISDEKYGKKKAELQARLQGIQDAYETETEKIRLERTLEATKIGLEAGEEIANKFSERYAERLKQEEELKEQLKNKEITQAEYEKKVLELRKKNQRAFFKDMLVMILESLRASANAAIAEIAIKNMAKNAALPGGMIKAAIETAIMTAAVNAAFGIAKAKLTAKQYATGKYPVTGAMDGKTYNASYAGMPKTGIYNGPQLGLFNENPKMPEMVVDGLTTRKIMVNYPSIYKSIMALAAGRAPQYAVGKYPQMTEQSNAADNTALMNEILYYLKNPKSAMVDPYAIADELKRIDGRKVV